MKKVFKKTVAALLSLSMTFSFFACSIVIETDSGSGGSDWSGSGSFSEDASNDGSSDGPTGGNVSGGSTPGGGGTPDDTTSDDSGSGNGSSSDLGGGSGNSSDGGSSSSSSSGPNNSSNVSDDNVGGDDTTDLAPLSIHFLELGLYNTGDCTYIKAGDTDILIDAGAKRKSAPTITSYLSNYCTDGVLEYVIATHAHEDHIAGFVGENGKKQGVFDLYRVGTLIDFPKSKSTSGIYSDYKNLRSSIITKYGTKHYTALEWWNGVDGLPRSIEVADGITMNVLYQKYYETSGDENDYSVCVLFSQGDNHYLFTGDLEEKGEASLLERNDLPKVKLYKAGHHGSKTSSTSALMAKIQPEVVCVCCCAGSSEYNAAPENTFPTQTFINNVAPYTKKIYVTSLAINDSNGKTTGFTSMNGNIVVSSMGGALTVNCSNSNTILKETAWFKANRKWPSNGVK